MTAVEKSPANAADGDARALSQYVEEFASVLVESGVPRMPARVLSRLLVTEGGALTSVELSDSLKISAAAVSGAVRYLVALHMVRRTREPGARREIYRVDRNIIYQAAVGQMPVMGHWEGVLAEGVELLGADSDAGKRLAESAEFISFMTSEMEGVLERWRAYQAERSGEPAD